MSEYLPDHENILKAFEFSARRSEGERAECTDKYMSTRAELQQRQKFKGEEYINQNEALLIQAFDTIRQLKAKLNNKVGIERVKEPIAIIGHSCQLPGNIYSLEELWQVLVNGDCVTSTIPVSRWQTKSTHPFFAGYIENPFGFDNQFFGISPKEAYHLDPQHRLLLMRTEEALRAASINPQTLLHSTTGVFLGIGNLDYYQRIALCRDTKIDAYIASGNSPSMAAGRISHYYGLKGPSVAFDTACSSSLYGIHLACQSIQANECTFAIVGAVNLLLTPLLHENFTQAGMLALDGKCKVFSAHANGYVRAEGCGVIILTTLSKAEKENYPILAVIKGSAVNHDGRTSGITVPHGPSQVAVIEQALLRAGVTANEIDYIETHGTGTSLGDPIEISALNQVFKNRKQPIPIGAIKANIGHLEIAAGMASLSKLLCLLHYRTIPPQIHCDSLNPLIDWSTSTVYVNTKQMPWPHANKEALVGVSGFGFSGTNVHLILASSPRPVEYLPKPEKLFKLTHFEVPYQPLSEVKELTVSPALYHENWYEGDLPVVFDQVRLQLLLQNSKIEPSLKTAYQQYCHLLQALELKCIERLLEVFASHFNIYTKAQLIHFSPKQFLGNNLLLRYEKMMVHLSSYLKNYFRENDFSDLTALSWNDLFNIYPEYHNEISFLNRCLEALIDILTGRQTATQLLFTGAQSSLAYQLYYSTATSQYFNHQIAQAINFYCDKIAAKDQTIRILEVGAGSGATTRYILPHLVNYKVIYYFTDISPYFLQRAQEDFINYDFVRYELIDLTNVTAASIIETGQFDIIIASNVLHATASVRKSTELLYQCLKSNGLFILRECTKSTLTADLTFGLSEGWWAFLTDDDRKNYPLLAVEQWNVLLHEVGFQQVEIMDAITDTYERVILATPQDKQYHTTDIFLLTNNNVLIDQANTAKIQWANLADVYQRDNINTISCDDLSHAYYQTLFAQLDKNLYKNIHIVMCFDAKSVRNFDLNEAWQNIFLTIIYCLQALKQCPQLGKIKFFLVVQDSWNTLRHEKSLLTYHCLAGSIAGLARVIALEYPDIYGGLLTIDVFNLQAILNAVLKESYLQTEEREIRIQQNTRYVRRLNSVQLESKINPIAIDSKACYLITGASGGVGIQTIKWLAQQGVRYFVLIARHIHTSTNPAFTACLHELKSLGVEVLCIALDISQKEAMQTLFARFGRDLPILKGVFHSAGVGGDCLIENIHTDTLPDMINTKVLGSYYLHQYTQNHALDYFVIYSSVISTWGAKARAHYAAVNAFSVALVTARRQLGLPGLVVDWGPWENVGMINSHSQSLANSVGMFAADSAAYFEMLLHAIRQKLTYVIIVAMDWQRFARCYGIYHAYHLVDQLINKSKNDQMQMEFNKLPEKVTEQNISDQIARILATVLGYESMEAINYQRGFYDQGLDSLLALSFIDELEKVFICKIKLSDLFGYPNVMALSQYLSGCITAQSIDRHPTDSEESAPVTALSDFIAQIDEKIDEFNTNGL